MKMVISFFSENPAYLFMAILVFLVAVGLISKAISAAVNAVARIVTIPFKTLLSWRALKLGYSSVTFDDVSIQKGTDGNTTFKNSEDRTTNEDTDNCASSEETNEPEQHTTIDFIKERKKRNK